MGVSKHRGGELAPVNLDFTHGRLSGFWIESRWASRGKRAATCDQCGAVIPAASQSDWVPVAKFVRGGAIRFASPKRGNGCVGLRAKEFAEHAVFAAGGGLLRMVRAHARGLPPEVGTLRRGPIFLCARITCKTQGGDAACGATGSGFLGVGADARSLFDRLCANLETCG